MQGFTLHVDQADLSLVILLLPLSSKCWDYKHALQCPAWILCNSYNFLVSSFICLFVTTLGIELGLYVY